jgi:hypothetical protein
MGGGDGGMDMGGGDGGMDMGGGDGGMDMGGGDGGMDMGDHGGGSSHGDHSTPTITPPGAGASQAEINAYVAEVRAQGETHPANHDMSMMNEHMAAMGLVDRADATHIAVRDGQWDDPNTWHNGQVPGDGARALIPEGIEVDYSVVSDASLFTVRVDGVLDFATDTDSQMVFDTIVVSPTGHLIMGTETNPVNPDVNIDLIVADNGPIDTNWDPMLLSRGLVSHGEATIHGAVKDSHEKVIEDPMAGDTSVSFAEAPEGWQVGDTIVIAGTEFDGHRWNNDAQAITLYPSEDEIRVITSIEGNTVYFDEPLVHDHDTPRADLKTSVANYTRNVSIETENAEDVEVFERGHVMFMHSDDVDVRYMEFHELGRTDKSDPSFPIGDGTSDPTANVQGRYSLHIHRTGTADQDNPTILEGNAVYGSPGWGIVHHDSHANLTNNATFDTFGSGIVSETGNETGLWHDNIAIYAEGISWQTPKNASTITEDTFDIGRGGEGFWLQSRMIDVQDNVAASVNTGFAFFHRDGANTMINFDSDVFAYPDALFDRENVTGDDAPILFFSGNETFAANQGMHVVKANTMQGHDVWTHLDDFTAWSVMRGLELEYTSHYLLTDFDLVARDPEQFSQPNYGIVTGSNMTDLVIVDARIDGFDTGINLIKHFPDNIPQGRPDDFQYTIIDAEITNVRQAYENFDPSLDTIMSRSDLPNLDPDLTLNPLSYTGGSVIITGTKADTLGIIDFPSGIEGDLEIYGSEFIRILENDGYWTTSSGQNYALLDIYFSDRVTGEVFYETHPVMIGSNVPLGRGDWSNISSNGTQNISNGMAGDRVLYEAIEAVPFAHMSSSQTMSAMPEGHDDMAHMAAMTSDVASATWMDGYDDDPASLLVTDGLFVNTGDASDLDLYTSGGEAVLATDGATFELSAGRTLAVVEAAAEVGFDGTDGDMAILDMEEGSTVAFTASEDGLGTIEEFDSSAFTGETDVLSGIDLGGATLAIDLTELGTDAGSSFTLMSADEITGLFDDTTFNGLGARDARITIDYENDRVTLDLTDGTGAVAVETVGAESDVTSGEEALWAALTSGQGVVSDDPIVDDEDDLFEDAA